MKDLVFSFIFGGIIFSSITYYVNNNNPEIGSVILAAPKIFIPTLIYFWYIKTPYRKIKIYINKLLPLLLVTITWLFIFVGSMKIFGNNKSDLVFLILILTSILTFYLLYLVYKSINTDKLNFL